MRIRIRHESRYSYGAPARGAIQKLRMTPRQCGSQSIIGWRVDIDHDCRLLASEDAFGNILHCFSVEGPIDALTTLVEGEVETFDTAGVLTGAVERFPPELYLRDTPLTECDDSLRAFAHALAGSRPDSLSKSHELMAGLYAVMTFDADATHSSTTAAEAFAHKKGVCQDFAHLFIACARALEIPARYVSGYYWRSDGVEQQSAGHAWAEAFVENLGWVGFDPAHGVSPGEAYVRIASALDYLGAAPIRGAHMGGGGETLSVDVTVRAQAQAQSQA